jgi:hypothetical protein
MAKFLNIMCQWLVSICILIIFAMSLRNFVNYWLSSGWVQVTARINTIKITNTFNSGESTNWSGQYNNFLCNYTYSFNGQTYSGNRGNIETFTTDSQRHIEYRLLRESLAENNSITIWVNPAAPMQSVLFRCQKLVLANDLIGLAFGIAWFGALLWYYKFRPKKDELGNEQK